MTIITHSVKLAKEITNVAHRTAYAMGQMFLDKHDFVQGRVRGTDGLYIKHGYRGLCDDEMTPISHLVVGARLKNKHALPHVSALSVMRLLRQSFVGNQAWLSDDVQVSVKRYMEPVAKFLAQYEQELDVFAGIYQNELTHTNVLGIFIMLKDMDREATRFAWEITIDDTDLVDVAEYAFHS